MHPTCRQKVRIEEMGFLLRTLPLLAVLSKVHRTISEECCYFKDSETALFALHHDSTLMYVSNSGEIDKTCFFKRKSAF